MKIERINENQIRCILTSFDLSVRNLNLGELAYGSEKARGLFREMIQKASNEVGFEAEDIPLMVEAIPLSNESVMLVITKIEDPEELDTRFAKFSPISDEDSDELSELANELLEGADGLLELLQKDSVPPADTDLPTDEPDAKEMPKRPSTRIFTFPGLDQIIDVAKAVGQVYEGKNTLYKKPESQTYFLVLTQDHTNELEFSRLCNLLSEYGTKIKPGYASEAYYTEHYERMIQDHALQKLSQL